MKKQPKKILLIILKDGTRYTYSIPEDKSYIDVYRYSLEVEGIDIDEVKTLRYFPNTLYEMEEIQYYYDDEKNIFDDVSMAVDFKIDEFRKQRALLFKALDTEFMRSLENKDCDECTDNIVKIKKHMRDLPDILIEHLGTLSVQQITSFNCFNNVYDIVLINGGSGYTEAPTVTVDPPIGETEGLTMEAKAFVSDGKVIKIEVTRPGTGYLTIPGVNISKPENGNTAMALASSPENDILNILQ